MDPSALSDPSLITPPLSATLQPTAVVRALNVNGWESNEMEMTSSLALQPLCPWDGLAAENGAEWDEMSGRGGATEVTRGHIMHNIAAARRITRLNSDRRKEHLTQLAVQ